MTVIDAIGGRFFYPGCASLWGWGGANARSSLWTLYSAAWFSCNFYDSSSEALYDVGNASYCISDLHDLCPHSASRGLPLSAAEHDNVPLPQSVGQELSIKVACVQCKYCIEL